MKATTRSSHCVVTPWIITKGAAELLDFLRQAFRAREKPASRITNDDGAIAHVEVEMGDSVVMVSDAKPDWPPTPSFLRLFVNDGDASFERAIDAGATRVTKMTDLPSGDRVGRVRDAWGNVWSIHQHVEDVSEDEMAARAGEPEAIKAKRYVEDTLDGVLGATAPHHR
jgi:PhnB protein